MHEKKKKDNVDTLDVILFTANLPDNNQQNLYMTLIRRMKHRKHTFESVSQCKSILVNTWRVTKSWVNIQLWWCVLLPTLRGKHWTQRWVRLLTLLKSTALFSRLTSCLPSVLAGWDWGETVWPVGRAEFSRSEIYFPTRQSSPVSYFSVWVSSMKTQRKNRCCS